ncbi:uncharacterized protein LOC131207584 [Anopheles bellator]|uniref:uncharacterized protein LOC131207584 n=1 Tax=Anopheles bellator TaxID=139047 RepID=UPI0026473449|nr:uncharacterized protein LOC131207584 [Anopheles bellator]
MYEVIDPLLLPTSQCGKFCRLCFNQADDLRALFPSSASISNKALLHKIFDCTTITLSYREDHDARICSNCIVSIEAFFKYKVQCTENDRLLRTKRASFFAGLGLAADLATSGHRVPALEHGQHKRRHHQIQQQPGEVFGVGDDDDSDDEERREGSKRQRTTNGEGEANGQEEEELETKEAEDGDGDDGGRLAYRIKQEVVPLARTEDDDDGLMLVEDDDSGGLVKDGGGDDGDDDDDDEEYFNPDQFLAQETQIDEGTDATIGDDEDGGDRDGGVSSDGDSGLIRNGHAGAEELLNSITAAAAMASSFERGWKTTEFAPQPGSSGMRTLKITDYSNVTGKRGRPQRFETDALLTAAAAAAAGNNLLAFHEELQRLNGLVGGRVAAQAGQLFPPDSRAQPHHSPAAVGASPVSRRLGPNGSVIEHTKKVQKFLDDGLRELIYNAGAPNPHYARDGGSTAFKVVKARFNSYNIIFDDNRFLRRNKSVSGLPKWYWACSVTGCPVKICSYAGRLFKTNELPHTHPATEPDADSKYETITPDPHEAEQLQRQLLLQQQQQHQLQQERMLRQQQQQQLLRQRQIEMAQRRVAAAAAMMAAAAVSARSTDTAPAEHPKAASAGGGRSNYELQTAADGTEMLLYGGHSLALIMTRKDGVRVYRCTSIVAEEGAVRRPCTDTIFLLTSGRIGRICKEEDVDYEMDLTPAAGEDQQRGEHGAEEDDKRRRMQKIIVYEGYRYKYCHARPEGNFYWRCVQRHEKDCLASLQTKRNLEFLKVNDQPHNHEAPDPSEPHENAMLCEIRLPVAGEQSDHGSTDFKLVKSGQKREFLIYKGYRYYFQYESKNGRRSYRCTMFKNCPAGAFLLPNSTIQEAKNFIHTHPPVEDMDKYITKDSLITSPIKVASSGSGGDAGAGGDGRPSTADVSPSKASEPSPDPPVAKDPEVARRNGYRIIKNYKNKEIMIYLGWRYFEDYKNKTGGQVWRCSSHRLCRGSVHLFSDGSINFAKLVDHNHSPPKKILNHHQSESTAVDRGDDGVALLEDGTAGTGLLPGGDDSLLRSWGGVYHRYITHQGHRFRFATRKREGTIYWRCAMRLVTKCPVSFHTKDDTYELVSTRNHEHNHPIPSVWPDVAGGQIEADLPQVRLPAEEVGTSDFVLTKNAKGRDLVLYRGGRFYLDYSRKDGKIVFRCSAVSGCRATVLLLPNRTLQVPEEFNHNHPTAQDTITGPTGWGAGSTAGDLTSSGVKTDDESGLDDSGAGRTVEPTPAKIILHDGYHFRFVSRHPTEQSAFYRCVWIDARKAQCPVALYTDLRGVVIQTSQQPHSHDPSDYGLVGGPPNTTAMANGTTHELIGTREYRIVKNWKNRDVLVFQNCRYFLHYVRKDGRKVWRCSAIRSCHAAVYLNADGTVDQFRGHHVHEIRPEGEPRRRRRRKKAELMVSFDGAVNGGTIYAGNGPVMLGAAELVARSRLIEGAVNGAVSMLNGNHVAGGGVGNAALMASIAGSLNGGGNHSNANSNNGAVGNEWIDYSDYGIRLNVASNDAGATSAARLPNEDNGSLWDHFHPHQALGEGTSDGRRGGEAASGFDLSYHSVFGNQENFAESVTYAAHAIAQHQLHQQHQRHLQQQLQLLNGHHSQQPPPPQHEISSDDHDEYEQGSGEEQQLQHDDRQPPLIHLEPEVKLEGDDL